MIKEEKQRWLKDRGEELQYTFEDIGPNSVVFDIGLYKGKWAERIARQYNPYIYGFEPVSEFYQDAKKVLAKYPKVKLFNFGLGRDTRQAPIFVNGDATSLINENGRREVVDIKSIKEVMPDFGRGFVDLASINIEGGEYELLSYMIGAGLMPKFGALLIQFHEVEGDSRLGRYKRANIRTMLRQTHEPIYIYDTVWELWKQTR